MARRHVMDIADIKVGKRIRKDMGELAGLVCDQRSKRCGVRAVAASFAA